MKGLLGWLKKNIIVVLSIVMILAFLPAGWIFSSKWNKSIQKDAADEYNKQRSSLQRAGSVNYALPAVFQGEGEVTESRPPNRAVTEFFRDQKERRTNQVAEVVERGTAFNQRDHDVLVEGLLPEAASERVRRQLGLEMAELISGTIEPDGTVVTPSIYRSLLRRVNAGMPPMPEDLAGSLQEFNDREQERFTAGSTDGKLSDEQQEQLASELVNRRLGEYAGRAKSLAFYASPEAFRTDGSDAWTGVPAPRQTDVTTYPAVTESMAYVWQWDYWIVSDLLQAFAQANTDSSTGAATVTDGVVKRVERVRISSFDASAPVQDPNSGGGRGRGSRGAAVPTGATDEIVTYTGRKGGDASSAFDVRTAEVTAVVSSQDLPRLFDAMGMVNNMTVVGLTIEPVDVWADLEDGFFYGSHHVVRATFLVETVWLRSWTEPLMPDPIRVKLGLAPLASEEGTDEP